MNSLSTYEKFALRKAAGTITDAERKAMPVGSESGSLLLQVDWMTSRLEDEEDVSQNIKWREVAMIMGSHLNKETMDAICREYKDGKGSALVKSKIKPPVQLKIEALMPKRTRNGKVNTIVDVRLVELVDSKTVRVSDSAPVEQVA